MESCGADPVAIQQPPKEEEKSTFSEIQSQTTKEEKKFNYDESRDYIQYKRRPYNHRGYSNHRGNVKNKLPKGNRHFPRLGEQNRNAPKRSKPPSQRRKMISDAE